MLAKKLRVPYDADILAGAVLLHDMAAYYLEQSGEDYHTFDGKYAAEVLKSIDFPKEKLDTALYAIANHGSDAKYRNADEPIEVTLLRDADKLDVFGPIGIARIIMVRTLKGDPLKKIVEDFYTKGHLQRKWDSITYDETRTIAKTKFEYSMNFFKKLSKSW